MAVGDQSSQNTSHLVLGAARSGKSRYAEGLIQACPAPYLYLATAQVLDIEMAERVRDHQHRRGTHWETLEVPFELVEQLRRLQGQGKAVLVDCLTLWLSNLLLQPAAPRDAALDRVNRLCSVVRTVDYPLVLVANEVGFGIVPENALARQFRDLAGWTNQQVASACKSVTLVVAGLPLVLK
jgi:adenosylcobinamide kinase / adenosylcobinamide-phosphate guanylyltransferase